MRVPDQGVDAAAERVEDVAVVPHDAFRHAGGSPGVEDVDVVIRARREVAFGRAVGDGVLVGDGCGRGIGLTVSRRR